MTTYLVAIGLIFALMMAGILVQRVYRSFARRHPELGPYRDKAGCGGCPDGGGCGTAGCTPSRRD